MTNLIKDRFTKNEPGHSISYKIACAPSEDSDQPAYSDQILRCLPEDALDPWQSVESDQTARMHRLIWIFAGRTRNVLTWLSYLF